MLAGMQLDVFTPLQAGAKTAEEIAHAIGVGPARLRLFFFSFAAAELFTEQDGHFSNTPQANHFLVKGIPFYMGGSASNLVLHPLGCGSQDCRIYSYWDTAG